MVSSGSSLLLIAVAVIEPRSSLLSLTSITTKSTNNW
jgi:hypothetical protein